MYAHLHIVQFVQDHPLDGNFLVSVQLAVPEDSVIPPQFVAHTDSFQSVELLKLMFLLS